MDVRDEMHKIRSCYAAAWEKYYHHLGSEDHLLIYQGG